MTFLSYST